MTYDEAIEKVMLENGEFASLKCLYEYIWHYKDKNEISGKTPNNTIQERCQRNPKFIRIAYGIYALRSFITASQSLQNIRIGQQDFRKALIQTLKECPITHIQDLKLLIASHIKPWVFCSHQERLDVCNGLLLSPLFDKLFDKSVGLITFAQDREILFSKKMDRSTRAYLNKLNLFNGKIIENLPTNGREAFLKYHYQHIYQK